MNMKRQYIILAILTTLCLHVSAQGFHTGYFTDGYLFRHEMNPAFENEKSYFSIPAIGNVNAKTMGNFGYENVVRDNPLYPTLSTKELTTFMNPYLDNQLKGFSKGNNKINAQAHVSILSAGFKKFGGYNTIELNVRGMAYGKIPYELFELATNTSNKNYQIGDVAFMAQSFAELAIGHSRQINERLRLGAKAKILVGVAQASIEMNDVTVDLMTQDKWTIHGDAQAHVSMKGFKYKSESKEYESRPGSYKRVNDVDIDGSGIGGIGFGVDLGGSYKISDDLQVSASLLDLGFISWSNDMYATNIEKDFVFDGFHDVDFIKAKDNHATHQVDKYSDQVSDFYNLKDMGDKGSRLTTLGATINLACQYILPSYRQLKFGALSSTRLQGKHTWTEMRLSGNIEPLKWLSGGASIAVNSYTTSLGWIVNIHPKSFNFFIGMDHLMGKFSKEMIPLSSNASVSVGFNVTW